MAYTNEAEVRAATGLTDANKVSSARITLKISYADSVINSKIGSAYSLPLTATCPFINFISLEICTLMLLMDIYGEESENGDKGWMKRLNATLKLLDEVQQLKMQLFDADGTELSRNTVRQPGFYPFFFLLFR